MSDLQHNKTKISIQVGLDGYSFKVQTPEGTKSSVWLSPDKMFALPEFQQRYDDVEISVFNPKCAMVPSQFFSPDRSADLLDEVVELSDNDRVNYVELPQFAAHMLYSSVTGESFSRVLAELVRRKDETKVVPLPEMYYMLQNLSDIPEYNKVLASYMGGWLYLVISQGRTLMLANAYKAPDFTTAEYYIFLALKKLQLNPEMSTIYFRTPLEDDAEISLYRYFKSVEQI